MTSADKSMPVDPDREVVNIDFDGRTVELRCGEIVPVEELVELRPGLWAYMAGPDSCGHYKVGQVLWDNTALDS